MDEGQQINTSHGSSQASNLEGGRSNSKEIQGQKSAQNNTGEKEKRDSQILFSHTVRTGDIRGTMEMIASGKSPDDNPDAKTGDEKNMPDNIIDLDEARKRKAQKNGQAKNPLSEEAIQEALQKKKPELTAKQQETVDHLIQNPQKLDALNTLMTERKGDLNKVRADLEQQLAETTDGKEKERISLLLLFLQLVFGLVQASAEGAVEGLKQAA